MSNNQVQTESTNLAVVEEDTLGSTVLPSEGWRNLQPNSYSSFGPSFKKDPRNPISKNAQLQKGMLTDEDSGVAFEMDVTKDAIDRFAKGIFRVEPKHCGNKGQSLYAVTGVTSTGYTVDALGDLGQHFLIYARGMADAANDGLRVVGSGSTSDEIKAASLTPETSPANATVEVAGWRGVSGDIELDADGNITSSLADFTTWGLNPFQWISVGDPNDANVSFLNPDFIGSARVRKVTTHKITLDRRNWLVEEKSYLDIGGITTNFDTVVEAETAGAGGDAVTVAAVDDGDPAVKASLDLSTKTAHVNTVVQAKAGGAAGDMITVEFTAGAPTAAGVLTEVGNNVKIKYKATSVASTVTDIETLIATSTLIEVKTPGTGANILDGTDAFASAALAGGVDADPPSVSESGSAVTLHFTGGATTVAEMEAVIDSDSTLIDVKTPGTAGHILVNTDDEFSATDLAHGASGSDAGTGRTVDVYFSRWYRNVATDHADYRTPSYAFEVAYQTLDDGSPEYEYMLGNMVDNWVWDFSLTSKAKVTAKFVGTRSLSPTASRKAGPVDALDPNVNLGVSTATDLIRLRIADHDEVGISTDFQSLKVTASNGVSPEKQLGQLGASKMNVGQHTEMVEASCIFTNDLVIKAVKDNRTNSLDIMMRNGDFGALLDVQSMTLDDANRKMERQKSVIVDSKAMGFQDLDSGSTASLSVFAYLPPIVADSDE